MCSVLNSASRFWRRSWRSRTLVVFITCMECQEFWELWWVPSQPAWHPRTFMEMGESALYICVNIIVYDDDFVLFMINEICTVFEIKLSLTWIMWCKCYKNGQTLIGCAIFLHRFQKVFSESGSDDWSPSQHGGMQALSLAVTLGMALFGGILTGGCAVCMLWCLCVQCIVICAFQVHLTICVHSLGLILKLPIYGSPPDTHCFEDSLYWEVNTSKSFNFIL